VVPAADVLLATLVAVLLGVTTKAGKHRARRGGAPRRSDQMLARVLLGEAARSDTRSAAAR